METINRLNEDTLSVTQEVVFNVDKTQLQEMRARFSAEIERIDTLLSNFN